MSVCRHWWKTGPCLALNIITFNGIESFKSITSSYHIQTLIHHSYTKLQTTSAHICCVTPHISSQIILLNARCSWKDKQSLYFHTSWFIIFITITTVMCLWSLCKMSDLVCKHVIHIETICDYTDLGALPLTRARRHTTNCIQDPYCRLPGSSARWLEHWTAFRQQMVLQGFHNKFLTNPVLLK